MNRVKLKKSSIMDYDVFIFDLDGTLYYQKPFRVKMLCVLIKYVLAHPAAIKDLMIIKTYRNVREHWAQHESDSSFAAEAELCERQYAYVAARHKTSVARVRRAVNFFMFEMPLNVLPPYRDEIFADFIRLLKEKEKTVVIYSDYPVEDKLGCLGLEADACFASCDARIDCMKPDTKGISVILNALGCGSSDAVMIGDRYDRDGLAAEGNNVDYVIADASPRERAKLKVLWNV